jgi:hypothetical protein
MAVMQSCEVETALLPLVKELVILCGSRSLKNVKLYQGNFYEHEN